MTRSHWVALLSVIVVGFIGFYIAGNTYWEDIPIPTPPKGEAITNPFYATQKFAEALGASTKRERILAVPSPKSVMVLSVWHWDLTPQRQAAIKPWVEAGGRLVVDSMLSGDLAEFESWSGIGWEYNEQAADKYFETLDDDQDYAESNRCVPAEEVTPNTGDTYELCGGNFSYLKASRPEQWALRDEVGPQAIRVAVGQGSVTIINGTPFTRQAIFDGDHSWAFIAATQLQRGDEIIFLTEDDHPPLLSLMWLYGAPVVVGVLVLVALFLWRGALRFGPTMGVPEPRRRSMAEQIRGSGHFAMKFGEGVALHTAAVRALTEAASRRIPAYARLPRPQKITALSKATGMSGESVLLAVDGASKRRPKELPNTLALIESARRQLLKSGE